MRFLAVVNTNTNVIESSHAISDDTDILTNDKIMKVYEITREQFDELEGRKARCDVIDDGVLDVVEIFNYEDLPPPPPPEPSEIELLVEYLLDVDFRVAMLELGLI